MMSVEAKEEENEYIRKRKDRGLDVHWDGALSLLLTINFSESNPSLHLKSQGNV